MQLPSVIFCQFYFDSFDYTLAERLLHRHLLDIFESWLFFNLIFDTSRGFIFIKCVSSTVRCLKNSMMFDLIVTIHRIIKLRSISNPECIFKSLNSLTLTHQFLLSVLSLYFPRYELSLLRLSTVAIVLLHVHYGVCVVRQMCAHFKIHALDVSYLAAKKTWDNFPENHHPE